MYIHRHTQKSKKLITTTKLSGRNKIKHIITININSLNSPVTMTKNVK